ncbi:TPX2 domain-containing protein/TPX2_importin domain-containing protein [Cephalotus follicularis]|uniref:TPX2 domain-containing protein/TPX2_importin domain-containing protein n=1 Tax=Cephalotus follicularis TaxID=3775 RepID=A0A1Q3CKE0_CEPFO|nr:TPX2 domain-containing protein/TPX2_importin domain-containing protein [Cephalotus follicularis]
MEVVCEESNGGMMIDEFYEFSAPRFFDFINGESQDDMRKAELWFDTALTYAPSPCMPRIKTSRTLKIESLCNFSEATGTDEVQQALQSTNSTATNRPGETKYQSDPIYDEISPTMSKISADKDTCKEDKGDAECSLGNGCVLAQSASSTAKIKPTGDREKTNNCVQEGTEACSPKPTISKQGELVTDCKKHQTARKIASLVKNSVAMKPKNQLQTSEAKGTKPTSMKKDDVKNTIGTPNLTQENQAIKRQKLEGGRTRQILNIKPPQNLPHKSKLGLKGGTSSFCSSVASTQKEYRKVYVREPATPFVSMAEMMKKFQSSTRDLSLPINTSLSHMKHKLTLTRPKEPDFETAQRVRSVKVKSTAELEEEMMAKIPKFKARPLNKKILEAPALPMLPRSKPQAPEFQEFHFETMSRANQNAETSSIASTEVSRQNNNPWKFHLTEPKTPQLHTSLRARPPRVKSSAELELEELEKVPKFKARALNKKIFESKGELGVFCNAKKHVTRPQEFHFAINERIPPPAAAVADLFDKLSLYSEPRHDNILPRNTTPNPFHLQTEERGAEKERKFVMEMSQKQLEEERARLRKANPYPFTTDYPVIPPKPEPKQCTKPEPFQLESLVRHEEEMQREMEERQRQEREEAQMRIFKAQPVLTEDPIPLPEKVRKPLTDVQEFNLHVDHRAVDRAEFDQKIKEKEMLYKRYREESESAKMMEEEKALKQMRRTMVPYARPLPTFDHPFCPQKSAKGTTKAKSPNLRVLRRKESRKMVSAVTAASSAAANMR